MHAMAQCHIHSRRIGTTWMTEASSSANNAAIQIINTFLMLSVKNIRDFMFEMEMLLQITTHL